MKTLQEVLNTDLSPDKVKEMSYAELNNFLIENEIVETDADIRMLIVEGIQRAVKEDDEFPIRYYKPEEEMPAESKVVENPGEMLTDDLVHQMRGVNQ
jgi:hypothetical protein